MSADITSVIRGNLERIHQRMAAACARVGSRPHFKTLIAVTKYAKAEWIAALRELKGQFDQNQHHFGENRPQQLVARAAEFPNDPKVALRSIAWHLIGHLQRNKVRLVLPHVNMIHSVDSLRLLEEIDQAAADLGHCPDLLLQVNLTGEETKGGFNAEQLAAEWPQLKNYPHIRILGLMTMAAETDDPESSRPVFRQLRELRDRLRVPSPFPWSLPYLSMGMSGDFEVAIEEGATHIRIGSALFEGLEAAD